MPPPGALRGEKRIEDLAHIRGRNSWAVVDDGGGDVAVRSGERNTDRLPWSRADEMACSALPIMLRNTCVKSLASPTTGGRLPGASNFTAIFFWRKDGCANWSAC